MLSLQNREKFEKIKIKCTALCFGQIWTPLQRPPFFFLLLLLTSSSHSGFIFIFISVLVLFFFNPFFPSVCFGFLFFFSFFNNAVPMHTQFFNKKIVFFLFNRGIRVNLYNLPFLSSNFFSQSNKKVFYPSTFPLPIKHHEKKLKSSIV